MEGLDAPRAPAQPPAGDGAAERRYASILDSIAGAFGSAELLSVEEGDDPHAAGTTSEAPSEG